MTSNNVSMINELKKDYFILKTFYLFLSNIIYFKTLVMIFT